MKPTNLLQFTAFILLGTVSLPAVPTDAKEVNPVEVGSTAPNVTLAKADTDFDWFPEVDWHNPLSS